MNGSVVSGNTGLRVRMSCDACATSKLRCGKERPRCKRCEMQGVSCSYSLSRKQRRSVLGAIPAIDRPAAGDAFEFQAYQNTCQPNQTDEITSNNMDFGHVDLSLPSVPAELQMAFGSQDQLSPNTISNGLRDGGISFEHGNDEYTSANSVSGSLGNAMVLPFPSMSHTSPSSRRQASPSSATEHNSIVKPCLQSACEVLCSFQWMETPSASLEIEAKETSCDEEASSSDLWSWEQENSQQTIGSAHLVSKQALQRVTQILNCRCRKNLSLVMLCSTIIQKILAVYLDIWQGSNESATQVNNAVSVGHVTLDKTDHEAIVQQLAIRGLEGARNLLDRLSTLPIDCQDDYLARSIHKDLQEWLRRNLQFALSKVQ